MATLTGKIAIVTGAGRGIGRAIAERLAQEGAQVVINYSASAAKAEEAVQQITANGGQAIAIQADLSKVAEIRKLFQVVEERLGGLDILINNAGIGLLKPTAEVTEEEFDSIFSLNTRGTFFAMQEAARRMRTGGRIISFSSGATILSTAGFGVYAASKAAIEQFSSALAKELGEKQITVNTILPTLIDTGTLVLPEEAINHFIQQTPLGRIGLPGDVADLVAFLVSDQARWITGQHLRISGGLI